jgi:hypothetical protein
MTKGDMAKQEKQWAAESDLRTLIEASKIRKDKARFAAAMKAHKEQEAALKGVVADQGKAGADKAGKAKDGM